MPKGESLDRCHIHVKESLTNKGMDSKKADGVAWGICKRNIPSESVSANSHMKKEHSDLDKIESEVNKLHTKHR